MRTVVTRVERGDGAAGRHMPPALAAVVSLLALAALLAASGCGSPARPGGKASGAPTATATATSSPPTPAPTPADPLARRVQQAIGDIASPVVTTYQPSDRTANVTATVGWSSTVAAAQEQVKAICFRAQRSLWTSGIALSQVTVLVLGPVIDQYGEPTTNAYGTAVLTAGTAAHFSWDTLSPDVAWQRYDNVFLRPNYNDASSVPASTA